MSIGHDLLPAAMVASRAAAGPPCLSGAADSSPAASPPATVVLTDRDLLREFIRSRDQAAFQQIVERHGALVLGVASRVLRDRHWAEDAFQATFLVLARKASSVRRQTSLASWLHGVARRIALRVLRQQYRQGEESLHTEPIMDASPLERVGSQWEQQILDEELQQLPAAWREPLILHELEGLSCEATAERLGLTLTALEGRLKRGRKELKHRLLRRGIGVGAVLAGLQAAHASAACQPAASLIAATVQLSLQTATVAGPAAAATETTITTTQQLATPYTPARDIRTYQPIATSLRNTSAWFHKLRRHPALSTRSLPCQTDAQTIRVCSPPVDDA
jgi:RNA polymerase sigma factor (sigma-70 family)